MLSSRFADPFSLAMSHLQLAIIALLFSCTANDTIGCDRTAKNNPR